MSDLLVLGLRLLFLALLWLFVLFALNVIRTDVFGRRITADSLVEPQPAPTPAVAAPQPQPQHRGRREASLHVTAGPQQGLAVPIGDSLLIGRTEDSGLTLDDQFMSTVHARITRSGRHFTVEDLGSTNGTYVNEQRLSGPRRLGPKDVLRIGRTTMALDA